MTIEKFKNALTNWVYTGNKPIEVSEPRWRGMLKWALTNNLNGASSSLKEVLQAIQEFRQ